MGPRRLSLGTKGPGGYRRGPRTLAAIAGDQGLSLGTKGPRGYRWGPRGLAAIAGGQEAQRLSPGTKGPGGYRRGPRGGRAVGRTDGPVFCSKISGAGFLFELFVPILLIIRPGNIL